MDRVLRNNSATVSATFAVDDTTLDSVGPVTVGITREDGTSLATGVATTHGGSGSGTYSVPLTSAQTAQLDVLSLTWTGDRTMTTQVEVVGGFYFELADLRALPDVSDTTKYPTARAKAARAWIEGVIDRVCGTSFVRRYHHDELTVLPVVSTIATADADWFNPYPPIFLRVPYAKELLSVSIAGTALGSVDLASLVLSSEGLVSAPQTGAVALGPGQVDIRYGAGFTDTVPDDLRQVAAQAARYRLVNVEGASGIPNRALSITNDFGNIRLASAGVNAPTGIPDVDAVILDWAGRVRIPAFA